MAQLKEEYTDVKRIRHPVEHQVIPHDDPADSEKILEELFAALKSPVGATASQRKRE